MKIQRFRRLLVLGFTVSVGLLALNAFISVSNFRRLAENNRQVLRTAEALRHLEETLSRLKDAETGQRGYLLTGDEAYLEPYNLALATLRQGLRRLGPLLDDDEQKDKVRALRGTIEEKLAELRETVELRRTGGREAARRVVLTGRGRRLMEHARELVAEIEGRERMLLAQRSSRSEVGLIWGVATFGFASAAALVLVGLLGLVVLRHLAQRQRSEQALREQLERWQVTLGSIGDAVIVTDDLGRVTFMNPLAASLCGCSSEAAAGRPLSETFRALNEATRQPAEDLVGRVLREGVVVGAADHTLLVGTDGVERPIQDSAAAIRDAQGRVTGVVLVFRDETERRMHEQELRTANRRKDEFLAMLAHELRNPLASIRSAVEVFDMPGAEVHLDWAKEVIGRQVNHLAHLLDDLLDVSRITRGIIALRKEMIDAYPVIHRAVESVRPLMDDRRHRLDVAISARTLRLEADPVRLEQVLVNLLANAAKYTPPGGQVRLSADRSGDQVVIRVADNGVGIAPEVLPQLFELFAQGERSLARSEGGLGVGLTIVKKLVDLHGGSVSARSEGTGKGSEFIIRLPAAYGQPDLGPAVAPEPARPKTSRILIVDDNRDLAVSLGRLLRVLGHAVETAYDGPSGIQAALRERPDTILLDIGLPGMDGYEVARTLRDDPRTRDVLIIAISGYGQEEDRRRSREAGMDHHLTKPVDINTIAELISQPT